MAKRALKRYQVQLTNNYYYKSFGWKNPMITRFDTLEECEANIAKRSIPNMYFRIKDTVTNTIVKEIHTEIKEDEYGY